MIQQNRFSADVDAADIGAGVLDRKIDVVCRVNRSDVIDRVSRCHADVVSGFHALADAVERAVRAVNHNIILGVGVAEQHHVLLGREGKIARRAVTAKDFNFIILIFGMQNQDSQGAVRSKIGKRGVALDGRSHAHRESAGFVIFLIIVGRCLDTAVNRIVTRQFIGGETDKLIVRAFHGHAFSALRIHHRRLDFHARRFCDGAARVDGEGIVRPFQRPVIKIQIAWHRLPGGDVAVDGHVAAGGGEFHVVLRRNLFVRLHTAVGFQRDVALGVIVIGVALGMKLRNDIERALRFRVFHRDIAADRGLHGKRQHIRAVLHRNAALDGRILGGTIHREDAERVARSLQIHRLCADGGDLLRRDARRISRFL